MLFVKGLVLPSNQQPKIETKNYPPLSLILLLWLHSNFTVCTHKVLLVLEKQILE